MLNYRLICLDIDGTLINSHSQITPATKEAIGKVSAAGAQVVLVSARMPMGIAPLCRQLGLGDSLIAFSGGMIVRGEQVLKDETLPLSATRLIYDATRRLGVHMSIYRHNDWRVEAMDPWAVQEGEITATTPTVGDFGPMLDAWEKEGLCPNKIMLMAEPDKIDLLNKTLTAQFGDALNIYPSKPTYLEIMPPRVSKTAAIEVLMEQMGITKEQVMAIGDNFNDLSMITFAALGIAMGNAPDEVKEKADAVTLSNDEDGVAAALYKYCLS
ncbi:MAG: HAD family phosphatase [Christensenellaceae bacterium]|nr:HAD family phosphatase [Christensenellaceae bacterium]